MGKLKTFEIVVHNANGTVKAGDRLLGQLVVQIIDDLTVKDIRVSLRGRAYVQWVETKHKASVSEIVHSNVLDPVIAEEVYLNESKILFPNQDLVSVTALRNNDTVTLHKGMHTFDFEFLVPRTVPNSLEGSSGIVRYTLEAALDRPCKFQTKVRTVYVSSVLDLNTLPSAREVVNLSDAMKVNSFLSTSGEISATLRLPCKGFTPLEALPVELKIHNGMQNDISKTSLKLKMIIVYRAQSKKFKQVINLAKCRLERIPAYSTLVECDRRLKIPALCPPSQMPGCNLIDVDYQIELNIKPTLLARKRLKLTSKILIGTQALNVTPPCLDEPPPYWSVFPPPYEDVTGASVCKQPPSLSTDVLETAPLTTCSMTSLSSVRKITNPVHTFALGLDEVLNDSADNQEGMAVLENFIPFSDTCPPFSSLESASQEFNQNRGR